MSQIDSVTLNTMSTPVTSTISFLPSNNSTYTPSTSSGYNFSSFGGPMCNPSFLNNNLSMTANEFHSQYPLNASNIHLTGDGHKLDFLINQMSSINQKLSKLDDIDQKLMSMSETISEHKASNDRRFLSLEKEIINKQDRIDKLENVVISMQRYLNSVDSGERSKNIIIFGLSEKMFTIEDFYGEKRNFSCDNSKVNGIIQVMQAGITEHEKIITENEKNQLEIFRIGKEMPGKNRTLKINCKSVEVRDKLLSNTKSLKNHNAFQKVYLKKDIHPVYNAENKRLHDKKKQLIYEAEKSSSGQVVEYKDGLLKVNDIAVDRNLFFRQ